MSGTSKFLENLDVPDIFFFLFSIQLTQFFPINTVFPLPDVTKETNL